MMPVFIILNSCLDVMPEVDAYVDSGYESISWDDFRWDIDYLDDGSCRLGPTAKRILNSSSVIFECWKEPKNIIAIVYK